MAHVGAEFPTEDTNTGENENDKLDNENPDSDVNQVINEIERIMSGSRVTISEREKIRNKITILTTMIQNLKTENTTLKAAARWLQNDVPNIIKQTAEALKPSLPPKPSFSDIIKGGQKPAVSKFKTLNSKQLFLKPRENLTVEKAKESFKQTLTPGKIK